MGALLYFDLVALAALWLFVWLTVGLVSFVRLITGFNREKAEAEAKR